MKKFKNVNTNEIITEKELNELHLREYFNQWYGSDTTDVVDDFKADDRTFLDYLIYQVKNDVDPDFIEIEENSSISDEYLRKLLEDRTFIDDDDYDYIIGHKEVLQVEDCGMSAMYEGKHWYNVLLRNGLDYDIYCD